MGDRSKQWVETAVGEGPTTTLPENLPIHRTTAVDWTNDRFGPPNPGSKPAQVIRRVWRRAEEGEEYVQASRFEVLGALPGVKFPAALPTDVRYITSQLVYTSQGRLAEPLLGAFGFWTIAPYSQSRTVGQSGVLRVFMPFPQPAEDAAGDGDGCGSFSDRVLESCTQIRLRGGTGWRLTDPTGTTLVWDDGPYRYELFHRPGVDDIVAGAVAESMVRLRFVEDSQPDLARLMRRAARAASR